MVELPGTGALRLTAPAYQAFDPSAVETAIMGHATPENVGGMYGFLLNARADRQASSDRYAGQLDRVNAVQSALARAKLEQDERENVRKTGVSLVQYGHAPMAALLPSFGLPGVADGHTPEQRMQMLRQGDELRNLATRAKALQESGAGAWDWTQAGVTFNEGQRTNSLDPAVLMGLSTNTQAPLRLREQALENEGKAAGRAADNSKIVATINPITQETQLQITGRDPADIHRRGTEASGLFRGQRDAQIRSMGGNMDSTVGAGGAVAPGASAPAPARVTGPAAPVRPTSGPATDAEKARAKPLEASIGTITGYVRRPDGLYAIGTGGKRARVP